MKLLKYPALALLCVAAVACTTAGGDWTSLMPDETFSNWRTVGTGPDAEASPEEIVISGNKVMIYAPADTSAPMPEFRNFVLSARVLTEPESASSLWFHHGDGYGYEIALGNRRLDGGMLKMGSLVNIRNIDQAAVPDGEWWNLEVAVRGKNITVKVDGKLLVDYVEPAEPYRPIEDMGLLGTGTFVIDSYEGTTRIRDMKVKALPDDASGRTDAIEESAAAPPHTYSPDTK